MDSPFYFYETINNFSNNIYIKLIKNILNRYDEIIVMKNGKIIEKGNFEDLINIKGYFYSLYTIQNDTLSL